ncbi:unnamed protein product [Ceratitis capitata]|uniref:(Mediterranean fruit fly) hypothetical protein n=1 Tax=Ceratitis capitata TaxID=7213 RepID=A0A811V0W0_CERCA|nr:unnamed protein product [Ceratitis capitata]
MHCDNTKTSSEIEHVDWSTGTGSGHHYANVSHYLGPKTSYMSKFVIFEIRFLKNYAHTFV